MNRRSLLQAQRAGRNPRLGQQNIAHPVECPPPLGGWNTRDSISAMKPEDAITLDNWLPQAGAVTVRPGSEVYSTGVGAGAVEALAEYNALGNRKLFAAGGGGIYDASVDDTPATLVASGFASNRWQTINFNAQMLWVAVGNTAQTYNGAVFAASTIAGPNIANLLGCHVHKGHVFVWEANSQDFWYSAVDTIGGGYTKFPLSRVTLKGGDLIAVGTWSFNVATTTGGPDDLAAFVFDSGEIIVYTGTDPGVAANWSLSGRFFCGEPLGVRCVEKTGANLVIQTVRDYESMSQIFIDQRKVANQTKAVGAIQEAARLYRDNFGWQLFYFPAGPWLIGNIPVSPTRMDQHILAIATGAWCRFVDLPAQCWGSFDGELFFGAVSGGKVWRLAAAETSDEDVAIEADGLTAWDQLRSAGKKRISAVRHVIGITGSPQTYETGIGVDFQPPLTTAPTTITSVGALWDVALWDVALWAAENTVDTRWRAAAAEGTHISRRVRVSTTQQIFWYRSDFLIEPSRGL